MRQSKWQLILGLVFLGILLVLAYFVVLFVFRFLGSLDQPLIAAILAAAAAVLTSTVTVVVGRIFERKKEIEAHFRQRKYDQYDELLKIIYGLMDQGDQPASDEDTTKRLREWQRKLILFAGPKAINAFVAWWANLKDGNPTAQTIFLMEEFFKALRADLGISNRGLAEGTFAHLILRHANLLIAMAKKNPNVSLAEIARMEQELDLIKKHDAVRDINELNTSQGNAKPSSELAG